MTIDGLSLKWDWGDRLEVNRGTEKWIFEVDSDLISYCHQEQNPYDTLLEALREVELKCVYYERKIKKIKEIKCQSQLEGSSMKP